MAGYENTNPDINRELGQAQNLAQLLENDPDARIFVYAGLDHIVEEEHDGRKRMAAYLREITNIDPLTVNQADVVGETENELVLIPSILMAEDERFDEAVDYFVINNLRARFETISAEELNPISLDNEVFKEYKDQDLLVKIFSPGEYSSFRSESIPILSWIKASSPEDSFDLFLPSGDFILEIMSAEEGRLMRKRISSEERQ